MRKINNKLKYLVSIIILILIIFSFILFLKISSKDSGNEDIVFYPYQYFQTINNVDNYFSNRKKLIIRENNILLVGRNEKELINEYYDIKFNINKYNMCIVINNLQKEDINFRSISNEYLNELKLFLIAILGERNINELINIIQEEYTNLRSKTNYTEDKVNFRQISIDKYNINFSVQNNMLKINIQT